LYEAAFTGLVVSATGLPVETALAAAILDHALKNAITLAGGGVAAIALGLSPTAGPAGDGEATPSIQTDGGSPAEVDGEGAAEPDGGSTTDAESEPSHPGSSRF
ncbi:TIGR00374 family protein, partial [Halorubrum sp. E3]